MDSNYSGAYNYSTMDHVRDPGAYTGTYIVLGGTAAFFPLLFVLYYLWTHIYSTVVRLTCRVQLEYSWEARMSVDFAGLFAPISVRPLQPPDTITTTARPCF